MAKNVQDLQAKMSPESRARSEATAERLIQEMALDELRAARALTQEHLSTILGVQQSAVSKLERRADMYVSTLRHVIEAMGGQLEIRAVFPDGDVRTPSFRRWRSRRPSGTRTPPKAPGTGGLLMADNILPFPRPHRGDPDPRRMALASIGFQWRAGLWHRGRVALSDADIDAMDVRTWAQCLRRWTRRRPRTR